MADEELQARLDALCRRAFDEAPLGPTRLSGRASQELWSFDVAGLGSPRGRVLRRSCSGAVDQPRYAAPPASRRTTA